MRISHNPRMPPVAPESPALYSLAPGFSCVQCAVLGPVPDKRRKAAEAASRRISINHETLPRTELPGFWLPPRCDTAALMHELEGHLLLASFDLLVTERKRATAVALKGAQ